MIEFTVSEYPAFLLFSPIISKEHYSAMTDNPCTAPSMNYDMASQGWELRTSTNNIPFRSLHLLSFFSFLHKEKKKKKKKRRFLLLGVNAVIFISWLPSQKVSIFPTPPI